MDNKDKIGKYSIEENIKGFTIQDIAENTSFIIFTSELLERDYSQVEEKILKILNDSGRIIAIIAKNKEEFLDGNYYDFTVVKYNEEKIAYNYYEGDYWLNYKKELTTFSSAMSFIVNYIEEMDDY